MKNIPDWLWPDLKNISSIDRAVTQGEWAAVIFAVINLIFAMVTSRTNELGYAILFVIFAFFISRYSRTAAVLALCFKVPDLLYGLFFQVDAFNFFMFILINGMRIVLMVMLINGLRGTFAFHRHRAKKSK
jgi:hypothetical protein